jgi:small-conductance mechanosensitive channel
MRLRQKHRNILCFLASLFLILGTLTGHAQGQLGGVIKTGQQAVPIVLDGEVLYEITVTDKTRDRRKHTVEALMGTLVQQAAQNSYTVDVKHERLNGSVDLFVYLIDSKDRPDEVAQKQRLFSVLEDDRILHNSTDLDDLAEQLAKTTEKAMQASVAERSRQAMLGQWARLLAILVATGLLEQRLVHLRHRRNSETEDTLWIESLLLIGIIAVPITAGMIGLGVFPATRNWQLGIGTIATKFLLFLAGIVGAMFTIKLTDSALRPLEISLERSLNVADKKAFSTIFDWIRGISFTVTLGLGATLGLQLAGVNSIPFVLTGSIVGVALSFASQDLIKDYINGTAILLNRSFEAGDVVEIGNQSGLVEFLSPRVTMLRNGHGHVITIPNRHVDKVVNLTKGWSRAVVSLVFPGEAGSEACVEMVDEIIREILNHPSISENLVVLNDDDPINKKHLDDFVDGNARFTIWVKVKPLSQWDVQSEIMLIYWKTLERRQLRIPAQKIAAILSTGTLSTGTVSTSTLSSPEPNNG